jgi:membrane protease subunit HflC
MNATAIEEDGPTPRRLGLRIAVGGATLLLLALYSSAVAVKERHVALITRFGELVRTIEEPGLSWKLPWPIESEVLVDQRLTVLASVPMEALTTDRRNIVIDTFAAWRVANVEQFYRALGSAARAEQVLSDIVKSKLRDAVGKVQLAKLISEERGQLGASEVEATILAEVQADTLTKYGIAVERIGFKRLSFPEANIAAVFEQMRAERKKEADQARADGQAEAERIRAETDREVRALIAGAESEAQMIRGRAETQIAQLLAEVEQLDPELFSTMIKLNALEQMISERSSLYFSTRHAPFDLFEQFERSTEADAPANEGD